MFVVYPVKYELIAHNLAVRIYILVNFGMTLLLLADTDFYLCESAS